MDKKIFKEAQGIVEVIREKLLILDTLIGDRGTFVKIRDMLEMLAYMCGQLDAQLLSQGTCD